MVAALPGWRCGDHCSLPGDARSRGRSRVAVLDYGAGEPHRCFRASVGAQMNADGGRRLTVVDSGPAGPAQSRASRFESIVGQALVLRAMLEQAARVATP